jgi:hypothetical protein
VTRIVPLLALALLAGLVLAQEAERDTWTDPKDVPPGYALQGEYQGELDNEKSGAQVIALGGDEFELVLLRGGLPGDGWTRENDRIPAIKGKLADGVVVFEHGGETARLSEGKIDFGEGGSMQKVARKSPTLGKEAPEGAIVLFDGENADAWQGGELTMDGLLAANCTSKQAFGDHSLHIEFRTPFKPFARDQARGNSGVYLQARYEVQVLDSFGLEGEDNECGGIYKVARPLVNMCYPPLVWQTYDVDFTAARYEEGEKTKNARVTIRHNGVVIHDDLELPKQTPGKHTESDAPGPIYLQGHGNPVVYRNVWVETR